MEVGAYYNKKAVTISVLLVMLTTFLELTFWDSSNIGVISLFFYLNLGICFLSSLSKSEKPSLLTCEEPVNYQICIDLMVLKTAVYVFISDLFYIPEIFYSFTGIALLIGILPIITLTLNTREFITSVSNTKMIMLITLLLIITFFVITMYIFSTSQSFWMFLAPNEIYF